jgi:hypothetical protein
MRSFIRSSQLLALVLLAACGPRSVENSPNPNSKTMLRVQNLNFADMVIYAVDAGQRVRLGTATGNSTKLFTIPAYLVQPGARLRFLADPIGSNQTPVSEQITVQPGDIVTLTIPPQ